MRSAIVTSRTEKSQENVEREGLERKQYGHKKGIRRSTVQRVCYHFYFFFVTLSSVDYV